MDLGLRGRVVVVTGGASNICKAICQQFAAEGATVALFDLDATMAQRTTAEITAAGGAVTPYVVDLTDTEATQAAVDAVEADLGPVAVLVNNVGWNGTAEFFLDLTPERWELAYRRNLFPTLNASRAALPRMVERREGALVSISSDAGFGEFRMADYGAMKAGVMSFSRTIAKEYGRFGIRSNVVCPGLVLPDPADVGENSLWAVDTKMGPTQIENITSGIPLRRRSEAVDIAWSVLFLASAQARQLSGQLLSVSGGFAMPR